MDGRAFGLDDGETDHEKGSDDSAKDAEDDVLPRSAPTSGRNRQSSKTCSETATAPLPVIQSQATTNVVMEFLTGSSKPPKLMRGLILTMAKSM